jgi:hypothetical protein
MGNTKEFRQHFKNLLGSVRQAEVSLPHGCMLVVGPNESLATIRASRCFHSLNIIYIYILYIYYIYIYINI